MTKPNNTSQFTISYRLGNGQKQRKIFVSAKNKKEAALLFYENSPENHILVNVEPAKDKESKLIQRRMIINNEFDEFILSKLKEIGATNGDLIQFLGITRNTWLRLRRNPEKFFIYDILKISKFLNTSVESIFNVIHKSIDSNKMDSPR